MGFDSARKSFRDELGHSGKQMVRIEKIGGWGGGRTHFGVEK